MKNNLPRKNRGSHPPDPTFAEHLAELRSRLTAWIMVFGLGSLVGYAWHDQLRQLLLRPLGQPVYYVSPAGGFDFVLRLSLGFGFLISLPVLMYQLFRFFEPALPDKHHRLLTGTLLSSSLLLLLGVGFAYYVSLPAALYFLNRFSGPDVQALISSQEYLTFVTHYVLGFGLVFQLPLGLFLLNAWQPLSMAQLLRWERWVIVLSFLLAAILTPTPDIFNQLIMALPLIGLYQFSVVGLWLINRQRSLSA